MLFDGIKGQDEAIRLLKAVISKGKVPHAYIFAGPKGSGRSVLARTFAKALNCEDAENAPCGSCASCGKIDRDTHPDVKWIRKEAKSSEIKIEQVRALESRIVLKPFEGKYKVYIVADAGLMSAAAANSFLKTLEEPPDNSLIILIAEDFKGLLPTIVSRCQLVRLRPFPKEEAEGKLDDVLEEFADDECLGNYAGANRGELSEKLSILAGWYRDLLVFKSTGNETLLVYRGRAGDIKKRVLSYEAGELARMFESVVNAKEKVESNVNPKLVLSAMLNEVR